MTQHLDADEEDGKKKSRRVITFLGRITPFPIHLKIKYQTNKTTFTK